MEKYLIEEYEVVEDEKWLRTEGEIEDYFSDNGHDYFDCGQGYYQDEAGLICKIGNKFYEVVLRAEIDSSKQDRGDRLYWVDRISNVEYEEIEKPQPKHRGEVQYNLSITNHQRTTLEKFMKDNHIKF